MSEKQSNIGGFIGFVLLSSQGWNKEKLIEDLKSDWNLTANDEAASEEGKDMIFAEVDGARLIISYMDFPVPNGEAEHFAGANYMWEEAVEVTSAHKAQILIAVMGDDNEAESILSRGATLVKAASSALSQENAVAVYTDGAVHHPAFYQAFSKMINDQEYPVFNLVWFGLYNTEERAGIYTYGMEKFGKDDIEVYVTPGSADLNEVRDFVASMVDYVLTSNVVLKDGETIGFSAEQKLAITKSAGIALENETIKIEYPTGN